MRSLKVFFSFCLCLFIGIGLHSCSKDGAEGELEDLIENEDDVDVDPIGTVYFETSFDAMVWGGNYITNERGLRPAFMQDPDQNNLRVIDESAEPVDSTPGTDGSMDFFEYMAPSYFVLREFEGWTGNKVYEKPGYIKVGTSASRDAFVATPAFAEISEERVNLKVVFKIARWGGASDQVYIEIIGGGIASVQSVPVNSHSSWDDGEFIINNATPNTRIRFVSDPYMDGRFFLDDIVVSKAE